MFVNQLECEMMLEVITQFKKGCGQCKTKFVGDWTPEMLQLISKLEEEMKQKKVKGRPTEFDAREASEVWEQGFCTTKKELAEYMCVSIRTLHRHWSSISDNLR